MATENIKRIHITYICIEDVFEKYTSINMMTHIYNISIPWYIVPGSHSFSEIYVKECFDFSFILQKAVYHRGQSCTYIAIFILHKHQRVYLHKHYIICINICTQTSVRWISIGPMRVRRNRRSNQKENNVNFVSRNIGLELSALGILVDLLPGLHVRHPSSEEMKT